MDVRVVRLPPQLGAEDVARSDEDRRVARPAPDDLRRDGMSRNVAASLDHLHHREAEAVPQIVAPTALIQRVQRQDVRLRQVADVDVVADAGAIGGGVVIAEDLDAFALAQGHLQRQRDEMRLGMMILAALGRGASGVEVAQRGIAQAVHAVEPVEQALQDVLRFAVGAARHDAFCLRDGDALRVVEEIGRRGEDEPLRAVSHGVLQQIQTVGDVIPQIFEGQRHGFADEGVGGEMHDGLGPLSLEQGLDGVEVGQIALDKDGLGGNGGAMAL